VLRFAQRQCDHEREDSGSNLHREPEPSVDGEAIEDQEDTGIDESDQHGARRQSRGDAST
jgi:hypothetical protein